MTNRALLDVSLRSLGRPVVSLTDISVLSRDNDAALWCPVLVSLFGTWVDKYRNLQAPRMPSDWAPVLSGFLQDIGWPGDRVLDSIEYQTLEVWNELLSELARLDSVSGRIPLDAALGILGDLASSRLFQPETAPAPVQILGVFETAGLRFDRLWIMGMHDGAWPAAPAPIPSCRFACSGVSTCAARHRNGNWRSLGCSRTTSYRVRQPPSSAIPSGKAIQISGPARFTDLCRLPRQTTWGFSLHPDTWNNY